MKDPIEEFVRQREALKERRRELAEELRRIDNVLRGTRTDKARTHRRADSISGRVEKFVLENEGCSIVTISAATGIPNNRVSSAITSLHRAGRVDRERSPDNKV